MDFEVVIAGAGIIGLALGKVFSENNFNIILLEKNKKVGAETSSRNSGVIHAGIYYEANSHKAKFCKDGNRILYKYLLDRNIKYNKCGKLIICSNRSEERLLKNLFINAKSNSIELEFLNSNQTNKLEPNIDCFSSLFSESTGILDVNDLMLNFLADIDNKSGTLVFNSEVTKVIPSQDYIEFSLNNEKKKYKTKIFINACGLSSNALINNIQTFPKKNLKKVSLLKGNYFKLIGKSPFSRLIYPLPNKKSLGIHSTINLNGETIFGPDEESIEKIDYEVNPNRENAFRNKIKKFWPQIEKRRIIPDYSGIRALYNDNNDFIIQTKYSHGIGGLVNLLNINSPGLTSSLSLANYILRLVKQNRIF